MFGLIYRVIRFSLLLNSPPQKREVCASGVRDAFIAGVVARVVGKICLFFVNWISSAARGKLSSIAVKFECSQCKVGRSSFRERAGCIDYGATHAKDNRLVQCVPL